MKINQELKSISTSKLIESHPKLIKLGFNHREIKSITTVVGGSKTIFAVIECYKSMTESCNMTHKEIYTIASKVSAYHAINNMSFFYNELRRLNFSHEEIIKIASHDAPAKGMQSVIDHYENLQKLSLTHKDIMQITSHDDIAAMMDVFLEFYKKFIELGYSKEELLIIAARNCPAKTMRTAIESSEFFKECSYSKKQISNILESGGVSVVVDMLHNYQKKLTQLGFDNNQILRIVKRKVDSAKKPKRPRDLTIKRVIEFSEELKRLNFTNEQILKIALGMDGSQKMGFVIECYQKLIDFHLEHEEIVMLAEKSDGESQLKQRLQELSDHSQEEELLFFLFEQDNEEKEELDPSQDEEEELDSIIDMDYGDISELGLFDNETITPVPKVTNTSSSLATIGFFEGKKRPLSDDIAPISTTSSRKRLKIGAKKLPESTTPTMPFSF